MDARIEEDIKVDLLSKCFSALNEAKIMMKHLEEYRILPTDSEKEKFLKKGNRENILISLGRAGELAFKYLIKIKMIQLYPNEPYEQFVKKVRSPSAKFIKNELADQKHVISQQDADELIAFQDDNDQKAHNYSYQNLFASKLIPIIEKNLKSYYIYKVQGDYIMNLILEEYELGKIDNPIESELFEYLLFPSQLNYPRSDAVNDRIKKIIDKGKAAGDIFTRLRYFENNLTNQKNYTDNDIYDISYYIESLKEYVEGIFDANNNLYLSPEIIHAKRIAKLFHDSLNKSEEDIDQIFEKIQEIGYDFILPSILLYNYTIEEIEEIDELCNYYSLNPVLIYKNHISLKGLQLIIRKGYDKPLRLEQEEKQADKLLNMEISSSDLEPSKIIQKKEYTNPEDVEILDFEHDELHEEDGLDFYDYATEFYKRDNSMYQDADFYDSPDPQIEDTLYCFMQDEDLTEEEKYVESIIEINNQKKHEEKTRKPKS